MFEIGGTEDHDIAIGRGVLRKYNMTSRHHLSLASNSGAQSYARAQSALTRSLNEESEGNWTMARNVVTPAVGVPGDVQTEILEFDLHRAFPVPVSEVGIDEILNFKDKYSDEYEEIQSRIEVSRLEVVMSGGLSEALELEVARLEAALVKAKRAMKSNGINYRNEIVRTYVSAVTVGGATTAISAVGLGLAGGIALPLGAMAAGAVLYIRKREGVMSPGPWGDGVAYAALVGEHMGGGH